MNLSKQCAAFLRGKPGVGECRDFLNENGATLLKVLPSIPHQSQGEGIELLGPQVMAYLSQYQQLLAALQAFPDLTSFLRYSLQQIMAEGCHKALEFFVVFLVNYSIQEQYCRTLTGQIRNTGEALVVVNRLLQLSSTNACYLIINLARCIEDKLTTELIQRIAGRLQLRDERALQYAQMARNLFLHLRDNHSLVELFAPVVPSLALELTGKEFHEQFLASLKDFEKDQAGIFVADKPCHQDEVMYLVVECLILYVRLEKTAVKQFYCQLRECHAYMTEKHGPNEFNDALNILIEHCISEDEAGQQVDMGSARPHDNIDEVE